MGIVHSYSLCVVVAFEPAGFKGFAARAFASPILASSQFFLAIQ